MANRRNADGLWVRDGVTQAGKALAGEVDVAGPLHKNEYLIEYGNGLPTNAAGETMLGGVPQANAVVPANAIITSATFYVETAFAGATATLTFGMIQEDGSTAIDADGIDATIAVTAIDAVGDIIACDGALVGASIGSADGYLTVTTATADFTAGKGRLVIEYIVTE